MSARSEMIAALPANIITGFLGVGKTSAILNLLGSKPEHERWAILVNEFGEIGIDGSLYSGQSSEQEGVFIREVPGGCMCCMAGLPMQIALNQLISRAKPDRLLIETTGLGHPFEVLQTLSSSQYQEILSVQKVITLVDARKLSDARYREHETFQQQVAIADVILANKMELYCDEDRAALEAFVQRYGTESVKLKYTTQGRVHPDMLTGASTHLVHEHEHEHESTSNVLDDEPIPKGGYRQAINRMEGFESIGWRFDASCVFNQTCLFAFITGLNVQRLKAVVITQSGVFAYNLAEDTLTEVELSDCLESRIEIIADMIHEDWLSQLQKCMI